MFGIARGRVIIFPRPARAAATGGTVLAFLLVPVAAHAGGGGGSSPAGNYRWVLSDHVGTSVVQLNSAGDVIERRIVEPYGRRIDAGPPTENTQKFYAGHRLDDDENLYPAGARTYDAEAARFTSIDPVIADPVDPRTLHAYGYASANPVNYVDPTGELAQLIILAAASIEIVLPTVPGIVVVASATVADVVIAVAPAVVAATAVAAAIVDTATATATAGSLNPPGSYNCGGDLCIHHPPTLTQTGSTGPGARGAAKAAGLVAAGLVPPFGELLDIATIADPTAPLWVKGVAAASLAGNLMTGGLAPNFGAAARAGTNLLPGITRSGRLGQVALDHIVKRHWAGTAGRAGKFADGTTARSVRGLINETLQRGGIRPNTMNRPGHIFEHDFGRVIGIDSAGKPTTWLRVVRDLDGAIRTAFPF